MNPSLLRHVFFPLYHLSTGTGVMEQVRKLKKNQWLSADDVQNLQREKLVSLLRHAFENVPFYHKRLKQAGISLVDMKDFSIVSQIPLLTKKEINENRDAMVAQNGAGGRLIPNSTSGSTGEALHFYTDMRSWACRRAVVIRNQEWLGVLLGDRQAFLWGATMDIQRAKSFRNQLHRWFNNYTTLSSYDLSPRMLENYIRSLNDFKPILLTSYPGPLTELARFMIEKGPRVPTLRAIISSAETLYPWQKEAAQGAFSCPVYNRYGSREFADIAHECERREGLHINADRVFIEVLDANQRPCDTGHPGEIVITDLDNYGMPLIRYRIGDTGTLSDKYCSCGRGLPLLQSVEGRTLDVIRTPDGKALGGTFWTLLFRSRPGIASFQIVQDKIDGITVHYVKSDDIAKIPWDYFLNEIHYKCGTHFKVSLQEVNKIEKTVSGKTRFVVSNISK